jgi:hypothetical protein
MDDNGKPSWLISGYFDEISQGPRRTVIFIEDSFDYNIFYSNKDNRKRVT